MKLFNIFPFLRIVFNTGSGSVDIMRVLLMFVAVSFIFPLPVLAEKQIKKDLDNNGVIDQVLIYNDQGMIQRMETDENHDGVFDTDVFFNKKQEKEKLARDTDFDGKKDIWQFYAANKLVKLVKDENKDQKPDIWAYYNDGMLCKKQVDEDFDGIVDCEEIYGVDSKLVSLKEKNKGNRFFYITWFYDDAQSLMRAEEDKNQDGRVDIWYYYNKGRLASIEEDINLDGKADVWETYDSMETLVKRQLDLDFDGIPDFTDMHNT